MSFGSFRHGLLRHLVTELRLRASCAATTAPPPRKRRQDGLRVALGTSVLGCVPWRRCLSGPRPVVQLAGVDRSHESGHLRVTVTRLRRLPSGMHAGSMQSALRGRFIVWRADDPAFGHEPSASSRPTLRPRPSGLRRRGRASSTTGAGPSGLGTGSRRCSSELLVIAGNRSPSGETDRHGGPPLGVLLPTPSGNLSGFSAAQATARPSGRARAMRPIPVDSFGRLPGGSEAQQSSGCQRTDRRTTDLRVGPHRPSRSQTKPRLCLPHPSREMRDT